MVFQPGVSGNPAGPGVVVKKNSQLVKELLIKHVPDAVAVIVEALKEKENKTWAAKEILDRVYGKAAQQIDVGGEAGQAMTAVLRIITRAEEKQVKESQDDGVNS